MIGAVEMPRFWMRVRRQSNALRSYQLSQRWSQRAFVVAHDVQVAHAAVDVHDIHVECADDFAGRHGRVLAEIRGAKQAGLFRCYEDEELRAPRLHALRRGVCYRQNGRYSRRVVDGAVVDRVAAHHGANSEMIPVSAVGDVLVAHFRIYSAHHSDYVVGGHVLQAVLHRGVDDYSRRYRTEIARFGLLAKLRPAEPRPGEK